MYDYKYIYIHTYVCIYIYRYVYTLVIKHANEKPYLNFKPCFAVVTSSIEASQFSADQVLIGNWDPGTRQRVGI